MIRNFFLSLLFFFGPTLLIFILRNAFYILQHRRQQRANGVEIIDITPSEHGAPSPKFIALAITIGLIFAYLSWHQVSSPDENGRTYVPAQMNSEGKIVPGYYIPKAK
ncbi:MAG: hypothetical protein HQM07_02605 [Zetaproteobacteria bacterium]|nr:hypothetical protein [Zetaproteobacteria bacterium]